jgi:hypothetical protein
MQPRQLQSITPVILDVNALLGGRVRRRDDGTVMAKGRELPLKAIAARAGLVAEHEPAVPAGQPLHQLHDRRRLVGNLAEVAYLAAAAALGNGHRDALFVRVKSDKCCSMGHGLPPYE